MKQQTRKIAIADIHGCPKTLTALIAQMQLSKEDELTFLGDYIHRGEDSRGVIDVILGLQAKGFRVRALRGNHEQMLLNAINPATPIDVYERWYHIFGQKALQSFGNELEKYLPFFYALPFFIEDEQYIFVHAGLNFAVTNPLKDENALLWIRDFYPQIRKSWLKGRIIVHGHTPTTLPKIERQLKRLTQKSWFTTPALNLDAGCIFEGGHLVAADLTNGKLFVQQNIDAFYPDKFFF